MLFSSGMSGPMPTTPSTDDPAESRRLLPNHPHAAAVRFDKDEHVVRSRTAVISDQIIMLRLEQSEPAF
jgi:hypothetical protein